MAKKFEPLDDDEVVPPLRPAISEEARQTQMVNLAVNLVEKRLREGTATSQETTHYLKLADPKNVLEMRLLEARIAVEEAKKRQIDSEAHLDEMYEKAIAAMKRYSGHMNDVKEFEEGGENDEY